MHYNCASLSLSAFIHPNLQTASAVWLYGARRTCRDSSSFTWHQPCEPNSTVYTTSVDIRNMLWKAGHSCRTTCDASTVGLLQSGEQRYIKVIINPWWGQNLVFLSAAAHPCIFSCSSNTSCGHPGRGVSRGAGQSWGTSSGLWGPVPQGSATGLILEPRTCRLFCTTALFYVPYIN